VPASSRAAVWLSVFRRFESAEHHTRCRCSRLLEVGGCQRTHAAPTTWRIAQPETSGAGIHLSDRTPSPFGPGTPPVPGSTASTPKAVRRSGLHHTRYTGLAMTHLQHIATATAINVRPLGEWWRRRRSLKGVTPLRRAPTGLTPSGRLRQQCQCWDWAYSERQCVRVIADT
jgi:hypothetical protein